MSNNNQSTTKRNRLPGASRAASVSACGNSLSAGGRFCVSEKGAVMDVEAMRAYGRVIAMIEAAEDMRDYPGEYFPAKMRAEKALRDWEATYPEAAAKEIAEQKAWREAEEARKKKEYEESFIGRGLD